MGETSSTYWERRGGYGVSAGKPEGRNHLRAPGIDGLIIWIFKK